MSLKSINQNKYSSQIKTLDYNNLSFSFWVWGFWKMKIILILVFLSCISKCLVMASPGESQERSLGSNPLFGWTGCREANKKSVPEPPYWKHQLIPFAYLAKSKLWMTSNGIEKNSDQSEMVYSFFEECFATRWEWGETGSLVEWNIYLFNYLWPH